MQHLDLYDPDFKPHMFRGTSYSEPAGICSSACPFSMLLLLSFCSFIYIFFSLLLSSRLFSSRRFISLLFPSLLFSCFLLSFLIFCSWQFSFWVGQGQGHDARNARSSDHRIIGAFGPSDHRIIRPSDHRIIGPSDHPIIGSSYHQIIGPSDHRTTGPSDHRIIRSSDHRIRQPHDHKSTQKENCIKLPAPKLSSPHSSSYIMHPSQDCDNNAWQLDRTSAASVPM